MRKFFVVLVAMLAFVLPSFADSPLTSTDFYKAYAGESIVQAATKCNGKISKDVMAYLANDKNPIAVKLAAVNAVYMCADDIVARENSDIFVKYLLKNCNYQDENGIIGLGNASLLASLAYMMAMDDYSNVQPAADIIYCALDKQPNSLCVNMVTALIIAQSYMADYTKWGKVYTIVNSVVSDTSLEQDLSKEAVDIIMDYVSIYNE